MLKASKLTVLKSKPKKLIDLRTRWEHLSHRRKFALARQTISRRRPKWLERYKNLHSVGFGIRHKANVRQREESAGILFFVRRKGTKDAGGMLPDKIRIRIRMGKKYKYAEIPTDVLASGEGRLQQAPFAACDAADNPLELGNACCALSLVENQPAIYLLGCHHVFLDSGDNPGFKPGPVDHIDFNGNRVGTVALAGPMNPGSPPTEPSYDAALANIENAARATLSSYWMFWKPKNLANTFLPIPLNGNYAVYSNGIMIPVAFIGWAPNFVITDGSGLSIMIPEALLYNADTKAGDSGAALVDQANSVILGMHMALVPSCDTPTAQVCVAQPLWRLVTASGPFGMDLFLGNL